MTNPKIAGIFDSAHSAEQARERLLEAGVAIHRIVVSAERPHSTVRVVTVAARSQVDKQHIAELMKRSGAQDTVTPV
jgi:hypothetical protein